MLDFEATCEQRGQDSAWEPAEQEILEFPVGLIDLEVGEVVDTFRRIVRPVLQPQLTAFCSQLTSIQQHQVVGQPTIVEVLGHFQAWSERHGLTPENCCVATCGDWDLLQMWPRQVSLAPGLHTPALFRQWINLKLIFKQLTGRKGSGMMGMLRRAGIRHVGHHHLGIDDVRNLCNLALWMYDQGARYAPTWNLEHRVGHRRRLAKKRAKVERACADKRRALAELPTSVSDEVREQMAARLARLELELTRMWAVEAVFS